MMFCYISTLYWLAIFLIKVTCVFSRGTPAPPFAGCGKLLPQSQRPGGVSNVTIFTGGFMRTYLVFIPPKYDANAPAPLILSYHGGTRDAGDQLQLDQLTNAEFNTASIVIYPQGINDVWQGVPNVTTNDIQFTLDILDKVEELYCINPSRITATGKSDGAGFGNVLACNPVTSRRFAAFALVSGAYYINTLPCEASIVPIPCAPGRKDIPLLAFHGGNDTTIAFSGGARKGECLPSIPHFVQEWAVRDELGTMNVTTPLAVDTVTESFGWKRGRGLVELIYNSILGHDWPSTLPNADNTQLGHHVASFNATPILLAFFEAHPLGIWES